eukprot:CAMPEP_0117051576 /NCGR_PEP_ID=MMETSP0472-20121206/35632_1 /TAXON_ID=693140 ORGANISM="Tiarina fusus, Strain LIS" /NCGR_SAMPLE_ID=MMETSP0472 /ASSEMBLY_ACC=CAM_ASM_000603 /LENGTH=359 /DNA_ID=CAMNT_0004765835 /DNA_START=63 /DNA_END=1142 /DNA_ORIENTATION=+
MPKRSVASAPESATKKKAKINAEGKKDNDEPLPLTQWRVVLTGDFVVKSRPILEQALKSKGVTVTGSISGKTTHLILGESGRNEWGKPTGIGSSKYNQAVDKKLSIIKEKEIWAILSGTVTTTRLTAHKAASAVKKATKTSPLPTKILYAIQESGEAKLSLPKLKNELTDRYEMDCESTRAKNALKKALSTLVEEGKLEKTGSSFSIASIVEDGATAAADFELTAEDQSAVREANIKKLCPVDGRWRGLRVVSTQKSKSGRALCKCCGELIQKGEKQVQVSDDSLFQMIVFPRDHHEGVSRGYTEDNFGQDYTISRQEFNIHENCQDEANRKFRAIFDREWAKIRPQVIAQRSDDFNAK